MRLHVEMTRLLPTIVADLLRPLFGRRHAPESWHQVQGGILEGTWLHLSPSRMGQMLRGTYEQALVSAVVPLIRPGWICFDMGAHFGYYALLLAALVGEQGAVHAFEPVPYNVRLLELHVAKNQKGSVIHIYPLALSDTNGTAVLRASNAGHSSGQAYLWGVRVVEIPVMRRFRTLRVEQRRLDDLVAGRCRGAPPFHQDGRGGSRGGCPARWSGDTPDGQTCGGGGAAYSSERSGGRRSALRRRLSG